MKKTLASAAAVAFMAMFCAGNANAQQEVVVEEESISVVDAANCKTHYYVDKHDNWFLQLGAGIAVPMVENHLVSGDAKRHITATYNIAKYMTKI